MLVPVDLFVFEVIEAPILRVVTHERVGGFAKVVFKKAVAGLNEAGILGLESTRLMLRPSKASVFRKAFLAFESADVADFCDDSSRAYRANAGDRSERVGDIHELALNLLIQYLDLGLHGPHGGNGNRQHLIHRVVHRLR